MESFDSLVGLMGLTLLLIAFAAGFVDAVVGGGGLLQVPALFLLFPQLPPALLLGTSKAAGIWGTAWAAKRYGKVATAPWPWIGLIAVLAAGLSLLGARSVSYVNSDVFRLILPVLLFSVLVLTLVKSGFGEQDRHRYSRKQIPWSGLVLGGGLGFYDGFFGPGTGSLLLFLFIRWFGWNFLASAAAAKFVNLACSAAALWVFARQGNVWWTLGLSMAVMNLLGAHLGSHYAINVDKRRIKWIFAVVVTLLVVKTAWEALQNLKIFGS